MSAPGAVLRATKMRRTYATLILLFCTVNFTQASSKGITLSGADFAAQTFDYIVVGGGTAGLAVAARYVP